MNNAQQLSNLSIFELRDLARKVGVYSPTLLKKDDLITQIQAIFDGKIAPHKPKTKQGRPPKNISGYDNIVNVFLPKDLQNIETAEERLFNNALISETFDLNQNLADFDYAEENVVSGFLEILSNKNGILRRNIAMNTSINSLVYVSMHLIDTYNLKSGDEIVGNSKFLSLDKPMILTKVISINGIAENLWKSKRESFDELQYVKPSNEIVLSNSNDIWAQLQNKFSIKFGQNIYLYAHNNTYASKAFIHFMHQIEINNKKTKIIYLNPAITSKDIETVKKLTGIELFCADFSESFNVQQKMCFLAVNRAKRLCEIGFDVVFVVDDACSLAKLNDNLYNGEMFVAKNVLNAAKNTNKGSITIITSLPQNPATTLQEQALNTFNRLEDVALYVCDDDENMFDFNKSRTN